MNKPLDLRSYLGSWSYDPDNNARVVRAAAGREIMQDCLPPGIEQYEVDGGRMASDLIEWNRRWSIICRGWRWTGSAQKGKRERCCATCWTTRSYS